MEQIRIQVSPKQMSKLRNGHKVRVKKPAVAGEGVSLIVSPENFSVMTRAFTRNKGSEIVLSPQEILANREQAPTVEGGGIFGRKFDVKAEQVLGKRKKKDLYKYAKDVLNPLAKATITAGLAAGATSLGATNPALVPYLATAVPAASYLAYDYLDRPSSYHSNSGGPKTKEAKTLAGQYLEQQALDKLNAQLGTNMGNLSRAGLEQAVQDKVSQKLNASSIQLQQRLLSRLASGMEDASSLSPQEKELLKGTMYESLIGSGLHPFGAGLHPFGSGLYASNRRGGAIVGHNGGFVQQRPQALQSQPNSANFQFRYTLPVALQKMIEKDVI